MGTVTVAPDEGDWPTGRPVAPGGWRRAVVGLLVGSVAGVLALSSVRRLDGGRRASGDAIGRR